MPDVPLLPARGSIVVPLLDGPELVVSAMSFTRRHAAAALIFPERVLGRSSVNHTLRASRSRDDPWGRGRGARWPASRLPTWPLQGGDGRRDRLAGLLVPASDHRCLGDRLVGHQCGFDLGAEDAMARRSSRLRRGRVARSRPITQHHLARACITGALAAARRRNVLTQPRSHVKGHARPGPSSRRVRCPPHRGCRCGRRPSVWA